MRTVLARYQEFVRYFSTYAIKYFHQLCFSLLVNLQYCNYYIYAQTIKVKRQLRYLFFPKRYFDPFILAKTVKIWTTFWSLFHFSVTIFHFLITIFYFLVTIYIFYSLFLKTVFLYFQFFSIDHYFIWKFICPTLLLKKDRPQKEDFIGRNVFLEEREGENGFSHSRISIKLKDRSHIIFRHQSFAQKVLWAPKTTAF